MADRVVDMAVTGMVEIQGDGMELALVVSSGHLRHAGTCSLGAPTLQRTDRSPAEQSVGKRGRAAKSTINPCPGEPGCMHGCPDLTPFPRFFVPSRLLDEILLVLAQETRPSLHTIRGWCEQRKQQPCRVFLPRLGLGRGDSETRSVKTPRHRGTGAQGHNTVVQQGRIHQPGAVNHVRPSSHPSNRV